MRLLQILAVLMVVGGLDLTWAYPYGAPDQSCSTMMPEHYVNKTYGNPAHPPQGGKPYFSISVDQQYGITEGDMVYVTIIADEHYFEGFLVQAHHAWEQRTMGEFVITDSDTKLACWGEAVTHSDHKHYYHASFYWKAPALSEYTCVHFVATVVKGYSTYFMGVKSDEVCVDPVRYSGSDHFRPATPLLMLVVAMATALFTRK